MKIVVVGAEAAAISCARLYRYMGVNNIILIDSKGICDKTRTDLNKYKKEFEVDTPMSMEQAFTNADMVVGVSKPGSFTLEHIALMSSEPIIFTLANPTPEIYPQDVKKARPDAIIATGRSDFANQVNNVLGFPFIFRGALDVRAKKITIDMKVAAAAALAELARAEVPMYLNVIYNTTLVFGKDYIIPKPFDKRLIVEVSSAVAAAALRCKEREDCNFDIEAYRKELASLIV